MKYTELKAWEMDELLKSKEISSMDLLNEHIKKIESVDGEIHAFLSTRFDDAIKEAKNIDDMRSKNIDLPDFSGIPISIKDNINMKNTKTTCGSKMLENYVSPFDATVVEKLQESNLIIIGKTNLDEFAMGSTTKHSYFGPTKNPLNTELIPGGSSGGSAASVAANEVPISLGSDTGGSVRLPASYCGVVGIKPTYGTVSRYGVTSMANTFDQIGTFGRDVRDAFTLLKVIMGVDLKDSTSLKNDSYCGDIPFDDENAISYLKNLKIALPKQYYDNEYNDIVKEEFKRALGLLEKFGSKIDIVDMPYLECSIPTYHVIVNSEVSSNMSRFDGLRYGYRTDNYSSIDEMYNKSRAEGFGDEVKRRIMIGNHILSHDQMDSYFKRAMKVRTLIKSDYEKVFSNYDVVISPTAPSLPYKLNENLSAVETYMGDLFTVPINIAGNSAISVPLRKIEGLSVGIQFVADRFKDIKAIKAGLALERVEKNEY